MTRAPFLLVGLLLVAGCPSPERPQAQRADLGLKLDVHPGSRKSSGPSVGDTIQLRLSWSGESPAMLSALVQQPKQVTTWIVEPERAVTIDPGTSRAILNRSGPVTIRARTTHEGKLVVSNPLRLEIRDGKLVNQTVSSASKP